MHTTPCTICPLRTLRRALACLLLAALALPAAAATAPEPTLKELLRTGEAVSSSAAGKAAGGSAEAAGAEAPGSETPAAEETPGETPRSAVSAFLAAARSGDYERAAAFLDVPRASGGESPATMARHLDTVLSRTLWIDPTALSGDARGQTDDGLPADQDLLGRIALGERQVPVLLERVRHEGTRTWKFSGATLRLLPALYEQYGPGPLGEVLPPFFFGWHVLGVALWQWIGLGVLVLLAGVVAWLAATLAVRILAPIARRAGSEFAQSVVGITTGPLRLALGVLVFSAGKYLLRPSLALRAVLSSAEEALLILAVTWAFLRAVDVLTAIVRRRLLEHGQSQAVSLVPPGRKTLKLLIVALASIAALDNFGFNVTALLAGLGVGGIAVALAAQKSLENLFGAFTLYMDRPVRVGDFCGFGGRVGTVEEIGLRSTRVRTLDRTVVSIPNAEFANLQIENYTRRDRIWYHPTIGLRYETTPDQVRYVLVEVRKMLYAHPKVDPDPARIRFVGFGAFSLDLDVFAYVSVTDYGEYLEVAEDLNLRIMDIVERAGSSFAFPSQTTYLEPGQPLDPARREAVEKEVAAWREKRALYLPRFPPEKIRELNDTIEFPEPGSPRTDGSGS